MAARLVSAATDETDESRAAGGGPSDGAGPRGHWSAPERAVRPLAWLVLALCVVGPAVVLAVGSVRGDAALPQDWLTEGARLVNLDAEGNLPTFVSTMLLAGVSVGLAVAAVLLRGRGRRAWPLVLPALVAAFLALDELASLHEQLALLADLLGVGGGLVFTWVVPGAVVAVAVGAALLRAGHQLSAGLRWRLVVAGAVYLVGALGFEALSSPLFRPTPEGTAEAPVQSLPYVLVNAAEEGMEMLGALLALHAVLRLLRVAVTRWGLVIDLDPLRPALRALPAPRSATPTVPTGSAA